MKLESDVFQIQWWASYFVKATELQLHGKKSN